MKVSRREFTGLSTAAAALVAAHSTLVGAAIRGAALPALREFGYGQVAQVEGNKLTVNFDKAGEKRVIDNFVTRA